MKSVVEAVKEKKIIAIVRGVEEEKLIPLAEALYEGGIGLLEITFDASGKVSEEETAAQIGKLVEHFEEKMYIGAGTVLTEHQVELVHDAGGKFIISPDVSEAVIKRTKELDMISMPGALTPTEIMTAHRAGADFVKVFPAGEMGPSYIKAVKAPLSHIDLLAVGGIDHKNMRDYLAAGACGFGIASSLTNKAWIAGEEYEKITELAKKYVEAVQ